MSTLQRAAHEVSPVTSPGSSDPEGAWQKAMSRFEASLGRIKPAMDALAEAEHAEFAARAAVEEMAPPESLTVRTNVEFYFNDGLETPICRRYAQNVELYDEASIARFVRDDAAAGAHFLKVLTAWREQRRGLEVAHSAAKAEAEVKYTASAVAIDGSDAQLLRVLRTPAPGIRELRWKIETLHRADCNTRCEKLGWTYLLQELALITDGASETNARVN